MKNRPVILVLFAVLAAMCLLLRRSTAEENQPHMRSALQHLQEAREELQQAAHDKGGHREKALELTHNAISEVKAGIHYADEKR